MIGSTGQRRSARVMDDAQKLDAGLDVGARHPAQLARGSTVGRYLVTGLIGKGGMGEVYAAYDPELDRKVALKLLRTQPEVAADPREGQARLLREAQSIARLSDPNVVVIYDVGMYAERVFLAMEFIDGYTLGHWLLVKRRTWREVVTAFVAGGSGLACAHRSGIIHRDFKLDNVMITHDGKVRVMDFGLARPIDQQEAERDPSSTAPPLVPDLMVSQAATWADNEDQLVTRNLTRPSAQRPARVPTLLDSPLTESGELVGTPAYMAPEQHKGEMIDVRTDQFSFCVALHEALYGERPFEGRSVLELTTNVIAGRVRAAPANAKVPGWLRRVVLRGLRADRAARYPSMDALLQALRKDRSRKFRTAMAMTLPAIALTLSVGIAARGELRHRNLCLGGVAQLAGVWEPPGSPSDSGRRDEIRRAFLATGRPYAADSFTAVAAELDRYVSRWRDMHREACEATNLRGEQSAEVLDLRMACLDQCLAEAQDLTTVFVHPDADVVLRSVEAVQALKPIEPCADIATLRAVVRMPQNPAERLKLADLRTRLVSVKATVIAGRYQAAAASVSRLVEEAAQTNYAPVMAETLLQQGEIEELNGKSELAEKSYEQAIWLAEGSRHDEAVLEAAGQLIAVTGFSLRRHRDGERWASFTEAVLNRVGAGHDLMEAWRANNLATVYLDEERLEDALRMFGDAVAMKVRALGSKHFDVAISLGNEAEVLFLLGRTVEAVQKNQQVIDMFRDTLGPEHPRTAGAWASQAEYLDARGDYSQAGAAAERALAILDDEPAANPAQVATALVALGVSWYERHVPAQAVAPLERGLRIGVNGLLDAARHGIARFALARALDEAFGPSARSLALATMAREDFDENPRLEGWKRRVEQWLETRGAMSAAGSPRLPLRRVKSAPASSRERRRSP